ncbi:hypothetical protein FB45DRAFT_820169 [Roridomyces roridus]|uniref:Integrase catalytic domain-containing protein n=1 Tax=Roridomyces roridus TaxID=1738132 RepID=A0AAD7CJV5_9AGAR|nr:hypothetical protein FB45DRAFT_820169 [Roridomyces roridus]
MARGNQHKPLPPVDSVAAYILKYWKKRRTDKWILERLKAKHMDLDRYGMGLTSFIGMRESMGLFRTRKQGHDVESIQAAMGRLRLQYPKAGRQEMLGLLFHEESMSVSRRVITTYFALYEPELVRQRRARRLKRKRFWAAGVNDIWCVDQHDKWKYKFGLALHVGLEPFSGRYLWIKIWWTNSNPRLILKYYLDVVEELGFIPLVSQSDPGTENFGMANGHTLLRHMHDPALVGTLQHRWMNKTKNVMPEIAWSQLRRRFAPGFEDILDIGVTNGWYEPGNLRESLVFRFVFIPWLQAELDAYMDRLNDTQKRADRNKILPHGVPSDVFENPEEYGALDFKVRVRPDAIAQVRQLYAPPDHEVFALVPADFQELAMQFYNEISIPPPPVTRDNVWDVYLFILHRFEALDLELEERWGYAVTMSRDDYQEGLELLPNLQPLPQYDGPGGEAYLGGVNNGLGLDASHMARLDAMMNRDLPLPHGTLDIIEVPLPRAEFWGDDENEEEQEEEQVELLLVQGV